jgi:hypothetical protein
LLAVTVAALALLAGCVSHPAGIDAASQSTAASGSSSSATSSAASPSVATTGTRSGKPAASAPTSPSGSGTAGQGSITQTVPGRTIATKAAVPLSSPADFGNRVTAKISEVKPINATAQGPGEIAGPAVAVSITLDNGSSKSINLTNVVMNLQDKAGTPSVPMSASPAKPFSGNLAAGAKATAVYVFALPKNHVNPVTVSFSYTTEAPVVLFVGQAQ